LGTTLRLRDATVPHSGGGLAQQRFADERLDERGDVGVPETFVYTPSAPISAGRSRSHSSASGSTNKAPTAAAAEATAMRVANNSSGGRSS
jgi:hypothetical protein